LYRYVSDDLENNWIFNYFGDENYVKYDDPPWWGCTSPRIQLTHSLKAPGSNP
jgi:hypothetical protein